MNTEQLNSARLARWSQNGEARLTQEAAAEWLGTIGFCSYLPIGSAGAPPAASFLEAVVGRPAQTPSSGERARALEILARLIENSAVVPLKLGNSLGEEPDFVASEEALRYIYALRGDRNFKNGPSTAGNEKVTTLAQHCWQAIEQNGPLTVAAMQPILGRDITEAAIARALQELWTGLYVFPILSARGDGAQWELLSRRFPRQVAAGASTGQAESQSAMVSLYLHAAVAAMEDDVFAFLSPLASQSKLREVVRGLGSMRQLDIIDVGGRSHVCLQGGLLPEMVAQLSEEQLAAGSMPPEIEIEAASEQPKKFEPRKFVPKQFVPKKIAADGGSARRFSPKKFADRASGPLTSQLTSQRRPRNYPARPRPEFEGASGYRKAPAEGAARVATRGPGERARRWEKSSEIAGERPAERKSFPPRSPGFKASGFKKSPSFKSAGFKKSGGVKPWASKDSGPRAGSSAENGARKSWQSRPAGGAGAARFGAGERRDRNAGASLKPWQKEKPNFGDSSAAERRKPYAPKGKPSGYTASGFKSAGTRAAESRSAGAKPFAAKAGGGKPWASKGAASRVGSARSYAARNVDGSAPPSRGKNYGKPAGAGPGGAKPWSKRPFADAGDAGGKPRRREAPAATAASGSGGKPFWAKNPRGGKGSAAAGRSNRPRTGSKAGSKSGKKK